MSDGGLNGTSAGLRSAYALLGSVAKPGDTDAIETVCWPSGLHEIHPSVDLH